MPSRQVEISVRVLDHAKDLGLPAYESEAAAGMDVRAAIDSDLTLLPLARAAVPTGLEMAIPAGYEVQVRPRSGLAIKHGITLVNAPGTIDSDFRGEVKVLLINLGSEPFTITRGMRIAQLVPAPVTRGRWHQVEAVEETARGAGGFGSTGH